MTASELKYLHETNNPNSHFFSRATMKFFGDTMKNYGVKAHPDYYELWRKHPVKHGLKESAYFHKKTFKRVFMTAETERRLAQ